MKKGFSLIELSVVLVVIGTTLSGALTLATQKSESDKITETQTKVTKIENAIKLFLYRYQRLPCPADGTLVTGATNFGKEGTPTSSGCASSNFSSGTVYAGVVPTKTLGLPDNIMIDGWGRVFSYSVDARFANNDKYAVLPTGATITNSACDGTTSTYCFKYTYNISNLPSNIITVQDASHTTRANDAIYTLISHGKNGYGAYAYLNKSSGSASRLVYSGTLNSPDADEQENSETNPTGANTAFDTTFVQKTTDSTFDDYVYYYSANYLTDGANGVTDTSLCTAALDIAKNPGANSTCTGATSTVICEALGSKINALCWQSNY